jgi:archaellum component FlaF (FlaF/FlaG flagellin family)
LHNNLITYATDEYLLFLHHKKTFCSYLISINRYKLKKSTTIFFVKCTIILYVAAFTNIDAFKKGKAATPLITKGNCKVEVLGVEEFSAYTFTFNTNGTVKAIKDNIETNGEWIENNIDKKINIHFNTYNPTLQQLNNSWLIKNVTQNQLYIQSNKNNDGSFVTIASL